MNCKLSNYNLCSNHNFSAIAHGKAKYLSIESCFCAFRGRNIMNQKPIGKCQIVITDSVKKCIGQLGQIATNFSLLNFTIGLQMTQTMWLLVP